MPRVPKAAVCRQRASNRTRSPPAHEGFAGPLREREAQAEGCTRTAELIAVVVRAAHEHVIGVVRVDEPGAHDLGVART